MTTWRCPQGHRLHGAWRFDMWCLTCRADVVAIADHPADPPDYQPDEDDLAAAYHDAMTETSTP